MDESQTFTDDERRCLLSIARNAIEQGLALQRPPTIELGRYSATLTLPGASFVTLKRNLHLRGCIGSLVRERPLAEDINQNAYGAAFRDPRFPALTTIEFAEIEVSLSILSATAPINFTDESSLLSQLRPAIDGLVIRCGHRRATFLPSVWDSLREPAEFLARLKEKAGLGQRDTVEFAERYTVEEISE
jgi:uncharacterized protein